MTVRFLLETGSQIIHQALGRNFHPPPGGIAIREIITPLVIGFLGDLAFPQRIGSSLPFVQYPVQLSRLLAVTKIHPQAHIALGFLHIQAIPILQGEKGVHETDVGINIRNRNGMRRHTEDLSHLFRQVSLRIPTAPCAHRRNLLGNPAVARDVAVSFLNACGSGGSVHRWPLEVLPSFE